MRKLFLIVLVLASACKEVLYEEIPPAHSVAVFDQLWNEFRAMYGPFEERSVNWDAMRAKYRPMVSANSSEEELFGVLSAMLAELNDGHVNLVAPGRPSFSSYRVYREKIDNELFDAQVIKQNYLKNTFTESPSYLYGLIGNVMYIHLKDISDQTPILEKFLDENPNAQGIIIDLRHSFGGDFTWSFPALSRFTDQQRLVFSSQTRNGPSPTDFTAWHDWYLEPNAPHYGKPIVVLTDPYTISASERTAMAFNVIPQATLIGEPTAGAHSTMIGRELQNGWYYSVATQKTKFADGKTYEGIGVIPDIILKNDRANLLKGTDDVLQKALELFQ